MHKPNKSFDLNALSRFPNSIVSTSFNARSYHNRTLDEIEKPYTDLHSHNLKYQENMQIYKQKRRMANLTSTSSVNMALHKPIVPPSEIRQRNQRSVKDLI